MQADYLRYKKHCLTIKAMLSDYSVLRACRRLSLLHYQTYLQEICESINSNERRVILDYIHEFSIHVYCAYSGRVEFRDKYHKISDEGHDYQIEILKDLKTKSSLSLEILSKKKIIISEEKFSWSLLENEDSNIPDLFDWVHCSIPKQEVKKNYSEDKYLQDLLKQKYIETLEYTIHTSNFGMFLIQIFQHLSGLWNNNTALISSKVDIKKEHIDVVYFRSEIDDFKKEGSEFSEFWIQFLIKFFTKISLSKKIKQKILTTLKEKKYKMSPLVACHKIAEEAYLTIHEIKTLTTFLMEPIHHHGDLSYQFKTVCFLGFEFSINLILLYIENQLAIPSKLDKLIKDYRLFRSSYFKGDYNYNLLFKLDLKAVDKLRYFYEKFLLDKHDGDYYLKALNVYRKVFKE